MCFVHYFKGYDRATSVAGAVAASSAPPGSGLNAGATPLPQPPTTGSATGQSFMNLPIQLYGKDDPVGKKCRVKKYWFGLGTSITATVAGFEQISNSSQPGPFAAAFHQLKQWSKL